MNAVQFHQFGEAGVLQYEEVPRPSLVADRVIVRLHAAALNHLDVFLRSGEREKNIPLPHIPGADGAGVVDEVGEQVTEFRQGDRVVISPGIGCGECEFCTGGTENLCKTYHVLGTPENGTYCEYISLHPRNLVRLPDSISFSDAAAFALVALTAWQMLGTRAKLKAGETVLVQSAGSGVGSMGIQIAKLFGASVIATAGSDAKLEMARLLGADETVNYRELNVIDAVKRITAKQGVDVVFESTGGEIFEKSIPILAKGGRLVTCGSTINFRPTLDLRYVFSRQLSVLGSYMGTRQELILALQALEAGKVRPVIDSILPLAQAADAHRRIESRQNIGKVVLSI